MGDLLLDCVVEKYYLELTPSLRRELEKEKIMRVLRKDSEHLIFEKLLR